ncbi:MAG: hypothetical protein R2850_09325 [Bacteroidia bacterium]
MLSRLFLIVFTFYGFAALAQGNASTHFNVFVPAHNEQIHHDAALVVTALFDSTTFIITDDNLDGDSDDSVQGILMSGQSYVLYIRDNGINDDARYASDGIASHDGDFFIVKSNKNILVSQTSNGDNQHCFIPSVSGDSGGQKFLFYAGTSC